MKLAQSVSYPASTWFSRLGPVEDVIISSYAPKFSLSRCSSSDVQKAGKKYEEDALSFLGALCENFVPSPWLRYKLKKDTYWKWCQPDGLLLNFEARQIIVVEVKLNHTADAFVKLENLYLPLIRSLFPFPDWTISGVEFTKVYDSAVRLPMRNVKLYASILDIPEEVYGVVVWNSCLNAFKRAARATGLR